MASQQITEEAVYLCTGNPMPKDIEQIAFWLLNEPFSTSFKRNLNYHISIDLSNNSLSEYMLPSLFRYI
jgi:replication factor C subunit 3/5